MPTRPKKAAHNSDRPHLSQSRVKPSDATLILASTSAHRRALLSRLGLPFASVSPEVEETPHDNEPPAALARRLALQKANAVAAHYPQAWVLGADQTAAIGTLRLDKPGTDARARAQLQAMSGQSVQFHTAFALVRGTSCLAGDDVTTAHLRTLSASEIDRYLARESVLDCAGSFKCEGLGITLFNAIDSRDPTALIGLPLIALAEQLRQAGFSLP